jgi:hypothetical protein
LAQNRLVLRLDPRECAAAPRFTSSTSIASNARAIDITHARLANCDHLVIAAIGFLRTPLVLSGARDMLVCADRQTDAPSVELGHRLINRCEV